MNRLVWTEAFPKISNDRSCLFWEISAFPNDTDSKWRVGGNIGSPQELTRLELQRAVDEKDKKVRQYRRDCTELWLLLVLPLVPARKPAYGQFRWPVAADRWPVTTDFDKVFVFEEDSGSPLHELATVPASPV